MKILGVFVKNLAYIHAVIKLNGENFIKVIKQFRFVIININFLFYLSLHLFISIYYDRSLPF